MIVTFDTTRADHIGAYGKENAMTPHIDALAKDSILYEKALSPIPITLPSHSSIMTGKVPFTHGVRDNGIFALANENTTLAEILKGKGYMTAAAIGSFPLTSQFGINQGFDYFNDTIIQNNDTIFTPTSLPKGSLYFDERPASQVNEAIMPWIEENYQSPFFAWIHYFDPHHPHTPPSPYNYSFINDLYQGEIAYSDESFGNVIQQLKRLNIYNNTLIIFASDHGEGNGEHNEMTHLSLVYNSTLHVPLIIKYPMQMYSNIRIKNQWVGLIDIFPTVLNILGIEINFEIQGEILPKSDVNINTERELYVETLSSKFSRGWGEQRGLVKDNYKFIYGPRKELYYLKKDPNELENLFDKMPILAEKMKNDLQDFIDENQVEQINSSINVSQETLNTLRGLGYIQLNNSDVNHIDEKLNDEGLPPHLHVHTVNAYNNVKNLLYTGNYLKGSRLLSSLLENDPDNLSYLELYFYSEINLGNFQLAKEIIHKLPKNTFGAISKSDRLYYLAKIYLSEGNTLKAKRLLEESQTIDITTDGQYLLSEIYSQEKNLKKQQYHLKNIININNRYINIINDLAISYYLDNNRLAEATFQQAIKINPYYQITFYNYGVFLKNMKEFDRAIIQFKRAINVDNNYLAAHFALVETLVQNNEIEQAKASLNLMGQISKNNPYYKMAIKLIK
ncbi:MAG: sulfatase-like hydrolase/transferase [Marinicellaceae bacterium]